MLRARPKSEPPVLYAVVWSAVAIGLIVLDWRSWQRTAPEAARTLEDENVDQHR